MWNERLGKRSGKVGEFFTFFALGERQLGRHTAGNWIKATNWYFLKAVQLISARRVVLSRLLGVTTGPVNYSALFSYMFATLYIISTFRFIRPQDVLRFNAQDQPEFWYARYNMIFPPSFLHNRLSAHFIEINHIYAVEMLRRYQGARREILAERELCTPEERLTRYACNPNYVYEPLGADDEAMHRLKATGDF